MYPNTYNYLLKIEYDGTNFVGWQYQTNGNSIQEEIEKALSKLLSEKIRLIGAGRTDKGVHAFGQYANFLSKKKISNKDKFLDSINFFLKKNLISIIEVKRKNKLFNSRFNAKERIYEYRIVNRRANLSLKNNKAWHIKKKLNINALSKGAKLFEGTHDFSSCSALSPIKTMKSVKIKKIGCEITIQFRSKSFLQNQVRSMVGSLKYLSIGKWSYTNFKKVFYSKNRSRCAPPAPACGLYLKDVKY